MSEYDNTDKGALFKNDKAGNENWADYRGSLNVGGTDYWISAWLKTSKRGEKFMSLSVKAKSEHREPRPVTREPGGDDDFNDDVPF